MIKSFFEYIKEDKSNNPDTLKCVDDVLNMISELSDPGDSYAVLGKKEYTKPYYFDMTVEARLDSDPDFEKDSHFSKLPWEIFNFNKNGFSIDANTHIDDKESTIPNIIITLLINPALEDKKELRFRLLDIITHEFTHMTQTGWNRNAFKEIPTSFDKRKEAKDNFGYFLLPEEMESMVGGMYKRSKKEGSNLDQLFDNYLFPFVKDNIITKDEYFTVFKKWIEYSLEEYPDAKLNTKDPRISKIINSI
jgi:hypothetical protein